MIQTINQIILLKILQLKIACLVQLLQQQIVIKKWKYSGHEIGFYGKGMWSCGNDYSRNVIILGVDNDRKNDFLVLGASDTFGINTSFDAPKKV